MMTTDSRRALAALLGVVAPVLALIGACRSEQAAPPAGTSTSEPPAASAAQRSSPASSAPWGASTSAPLAASAAQGTDASAPTLDTREHPPSGSINKKSPWGTCPGDEVKRCVARYSKPKLSPADIKRFLDEGRPACFAQGDARKLAAQGACLPLTLGEDARNGKKVEVHYFCSDVCPNQGHVLIIYAGNSNENEEECCACGGRPRHDYAWGGYLGCEPPEVPLPRFYYSRRPGGPMDLATRSPCDPAKIMFEDGTVVLDPNMRQGN